MITSEQKREIIKLLPFRYAPIVQQRLIDKGLFNRNNKPYSNAQISNTMNGVENITIENVIYELVAEAKEIVDKRKSLLQDQ